jgi:cytochrome c oxidase subunit 2
MIYADGIREMQFGIQDPGSPLQEGIINFHHDLMVVMIFVVVFVGVILGRALYFFNEKKNKVSKAIVHGTVIEIVWTVIPALVLMMIAIPSFTLLYAVDEVVDPSLTVKVVGHQWYWSYELSDIGDGVEFD